MKKITFDLKKQILSGYVLLIGIFLINTLVSNYQRNKYEQVIHQSTQVIHPSILKLMEFNALVNNSKNLSSSWVSTELEDHKDKRELKKIHTTKYPKIKKELTELANNWTNKKAKKDLEKIIPILEKDVLGLQMNIMNGLSNFDSYSDIMIKMEIDSEYESMSTNASLVNKSISKLTQIIKTESDNNQVVMNKALSTIGTTNILLVVIIIVLGLSLGIIIANRLTKPIIKVKDTIDLMSKGVLPEVNFKVGNDEIGEISSSVTSLIKNIGRTTVFAENIGNGLLDEKYEKLSDDDVLGESLLDMRDKLNEAKIVEYRNSWVTQGLAKFAEILREDNDDMQILSVNIISNLVKYLGANQGGIFVINDDQKKPGMKLTAMYAYERKKFVDKEFIKGEGLIGQCWQEGEKIYMTDVPNNYINVTSGLGDANPTCVLIVPLKVNDEIYGVIEVASFSILEDHEVEFVQKVSESIASTLSSVKVNIRTAQLLKESQQMSEELQAQEEELRQNAEEMQATQEEMERNLNETRASLLIEKERISTIIHTCNDGVLVLDDKGEIIEHNPAFLLLFNISENKINEFKLAEVLSVKDNLVDYIEENIKRFVDIQLNESKFLSFAFNKLNLGDKNNYSIFIKDISQLKLGENVMQSSFFEFQKTLEEQKQINTNLSKEIEELKRAK